MSIGRQVAAEAIGQVVSEVVPGEFWIYLMGFASLFTLLPLAIMLLLALLVDKSRKGLTKETPPSLPAAGSAEEHRLHHLSMEAIGDELRNHIGREYQDGPVFGRTYRLYRSGLVGISLTLLGGLLCWTFLIPMLQNWWLHLYGALSGQVLIVDSGNVTGLLYVSTMLSMLAICLLPLWGGLYLLRRSALRKVLRMGDCPRLQMDILGVTDDGYFIPWREILEVTRRYSRDKEGKEECNLVLVIHNKNITREIKISSADFVGVPWKREWQESRDENYNWRWLHAMLAYQKTYYQQLTL